MNLPFVRGSSFVPRARHSTARSREQGTEATLSLEQREREGWGTRFLEADGDAGARIEVIAKSVAQKVEAEDAEHHRDGGEDNQMRRLEQERACVVQHASPAGGRRRHAESKEAEGGF